MSIHIYENGTESAQDGTEVTFLHFNGGVMADGAIKDVIKTFSIRTDGEVYNDIIITVGILNEAETTKPPYDSLKFMFEKNRNIKDFTYLNDEGGTYGYNVMLKELRDRNKNFSIRAKIKQLDGNSNTEGKLYFYTLESMCEVVE